MSNKWSVAAALVDKLPPCLSPGLPSSQICSCFALLLREYQKLGQVERGQRVRKWKNFPTYNIYFSITFFPCDFCFFFAMFAVFNTLFTKWNKVYWFCAIFVGCWIIISIHFCHDCRIFRLKVPRQIIEQIPEAEITLCTVYWAIGCNCFSFLLRCFYYTAMRCGWHVVFNLFWQQLATSSIK